MKYMEKIAKALEEGKDVNASKSGWVRGGYFYSYQTPVALLKDNKFFVTDLHYSQTTSRQVNYLKRYFDGKVEIVCGLFYL